MTAPDAPVVIRAWREKRDGARYDGQVMHCRFGDLRDRIERYCRQRRWAIAVLRNDDGTAAEDAVEVGWSFKHDDTGRWCWMSDGPDLSEPTAEPAS